RLELHAAHGEAAGDRAALLVGGPEATVRPARLGPWFVPLRDGRLKPLVPLVLLGEWGPRLHQPLDDLLVYLRLSALGHLVRERPEPSEILGAGSHLRLLLGRGDKEELPCGVGRGAAGAALERQPLGDGV